MNELLRKPRMPLAIKALLSVGVLLIVAALVWLLVSRKPATEAEAPWQAAMDNLEQMQQSDRETLQSLTQSLEALRVYARETATKVDNQQAEQDALAHTLQAVRQLAQSAHIAASGSEQDLKTLQAQLALLEQRLSQQAAAKPAAAVVKAVAPRSPSARTQTPLVPPFHVLDVDYRGGEIFLMIAPQASHSLGDIRLLREGDHLVGWQLARLSPQRAVFAVGNRSHTVELRPALGMN